MNEAKLATAKLDAIKGTISERLNDNAFAKSGATVNITLSTNQPEPPLCLHVENVDLVRAIYLLLEHDFDKVELLPTIKSDVFGDAAGALERFASAMKNTVRINAAGVVPVVAEENLPHIELRYEPTYERAYQHNNGWVQHNGALANNIRIEVLQDGARVLPDPPPAD